MCEAHFAHCVLGLLGPRPSESAVSDTRTTIVLNPLRSEDEAFRFLLYAIVAIAVIVGLVFALRALI